VSRAALIEDLRQKAAEDAEAVWRDAKSDAEKAKLDAARQIEEQRTSVSAEAAATARRLEEAAIAAADRKAREVLMTAAASLAERLRGLARAELARLRDEGAEALFAALAAELPPRRWQRVRVNPADLQFARTQFPKAEIESDASIAGGMAVEAEEGRIRVSNTLETRLDTAWPDILPGLVAGILQEYPGHRPPA
jgi:vacuolar-type H+-ATPase subunit E/Vma4